jgi:hypothetical protein
MLGRNGGGRKVPPPHGSGQSPTRARVKGIAKVPPPCFFRIAHLAGRLRASTIGLCLRWLNCHVCVSTIPSRGALPGFIPLTVFSEVYRLMLRRNSENFGIAEVFCNRRNTLRFLASSGERSYVRKGIMSGVSARIAWVLSALRSSV